MMSTASTVVSRGFGSDESMEDGFMDPKLASPDGSAFHGRADEYASLMDQPWHQLRMELIWSTLTRHLDKTHGTWLDVGCGNGELGLRALEGGHSVTLVDREPEMCALAARRIKARFGTSKAWQVLESQLGNLPAHQFAVVTAHNVLEYVPDRRGAIRELAGRVSPGGILSVVVANPMAVPFTIAVRTQDPRATRKALEEGGIRIGLSGVRKKVEPVHIEILDEELAERGMSRHGYYGLRIFNDVMTEEWRKSIPGWLDEMLATELLASDQEPYRSVARHLHLVYRRPKIASVVASRD